MEEIRDQDTYIEWHVVTTTYTDPERETTSEKYTTTETERYPVLFLNKEQRVILKKPD